MKRLPRLRFLAALLWASMCDRLSGRALAVNAVMTPNETSRGTQSMIPDNNVVITFRNALVKYGSDDRHFNVVSGVGDIPIGVLLNDQVDPGEFDTGAVSPSYIKKEVALFGLYHESLPGVASAGIGVGAYVVADPANPGQVIQLPAAAGTYIVIGRSRFTVVNPGDPVSIIHCLPFALTH